MPTCTEEETEAQRGYCVRSTLNANNSGVFLGLWSHGLGFPSRLLSAGGRGQRTLACCSPWGRKESGTMSGGTDCSAAYSAFPMLSSAPRRDLGGTVLTWLIVR